jgi:hypothetical protein
MMATEPTPQSVRSSLNVYRYFPIDIAEVHTEEGRLYLFVAIDRTSKFAFSTP